MRYYIAFPFLLAVALVQGSALFPLPILRVKPDLMLLAVVGWGMSMGVKEALIWGVVGGMLLDLLGGAPLGVSVLSIMPVALLSGVGETKVVESNLPLALVVIFLGTLLYDSFFLLLLQLLGNHVEWWGSFITLFLPTALLNTLLMPFAYWFFRWLGRRARPSGFVELPESGPLETR